MKKRWLLAVMVVGMFAMAQGVRAESDHRLGVGVNYWKMLHDIDVDDIDKNGISWLASYQYKPAALLKLEADLEVFPQGFQGTDSAAYAPEAYLVIGSGIYGAVGAGILYAGGKFADRPYYALRAGLDIEILPQLFMDVNVNYRMAARTDVSDVAEDINVDTIMLGAALRLGL